MTSNTSEWVDCKIETVAKSIQYGYTASSIASGEVHLLRITDIQDGSVNWSKVPFCEIHVDEYEKYALKKDDIVFARTGATVGKSYLIGELPVKSVFASYLIRITLNDAVLPKYVKHFFNSANYWDQINENAAGIGQPNFNSQKLKNIVFPLPPLPEQKRIVAKLDNLFAHLDQLKARLQNIPMLLKQFRQAVLTQAVTGKLTEEWRKSNEDSGWQTLRVGDVFEVVTGTTPPKTNHEYYGDKYPFYKPTSLNQGYYTYEADEYLSEEGIVKSRFLPEKSVLITAIGATISKTGLIRRPGACNQQIHAILPGNQAIPEFVYFQFIQDKLRLDIINNSSSTTLPILNKSRFNELEFVLPPLQEQEEIVRRIESLFAVADRIEASYTKLQEKIDHLPQAILSKAFRGELVEQDVELEL